MQHGSSDWRALACHALLFNALACASWRGLLLSQSLCREDGVGDGLLLFALAPAVS
jgi:hypothetical protein